MISIVFDPAKDLKDLKIGDGIIIQGDITGFNITEEGLVSLNADFEELDVEKRNRDSLSELRNSMDTALSAQSNRQPILRAG